MESQDIAFILQLMKKIKQRAQQTPPFFEDALCQHRLTDKIYAFSENF